MPAPILASNDTVIVGDARPRTTARPSHGPGFGAVLRQSADVVLRGVETAAAVVGGPLMSGAVRGARAGIGVTATLGPHAGAADASDGGTLDEVRALQEQAQSFNIEYLAIQEQLQQENRRFTSLSNVAKAMHDTSRGILQNIRS